MEKSTDKTAILMKRLQETEQEQMLILSICTALSSIVNKEEFDAVVNGTVKDNFLFDDFILTSSNEDESEYQIFYQSSNKNTDLKDYVLNDGFFNLCLDSADTVFFDLTKDQKNPDYLSLIHI